MIFGSILNDGLLGGGETPKPAVRRPSHTELAQWNKFLDQNGGEDEPLESLHRKYLQAGGTMPLDSLKNEIGLLGQNVKGMAVRRGHIYGEDTHTGYRFPEAKIDGKPAGPMNGDLKTSGPAPTKNPGTLVYKTVPSYVKELEWDENTNLPFYYDDNGDIKFVEQQHFYSKRFRKTKPDGGLLASK